MTLEELQARATEIANGSPASETEMRDLLMTAYREMMATRGEMLASVERSEWTVERAERAWKDAEQSWKDAENELRKLQDAAACVRECVAFIRDDEAEALSFKPSQISPQRLAKLLACAQAECQTMAAAVFEH